MSSTTETSADLVRLRTWFAAVRRDLPWRRPEAGAWGVLVSEIMLQQTPVARVLPVYEQWLTRWPTPADLAAEPPGEAVRAWGRLGYPRRALRLHEAAVAVVAEHGGQIPTTLESLLALPGVGTYTARAVAAFAHGQRHAVIDTNVRRVVVRWREGRADAVRLPLAAVEELLPVDEPAAVEVSAALMELGALVCSARSPQCSACPLADSCAWQAAGAPDAEAPLRRPQRYAGTDRQVRGRMLGVLRDVPGPVRREELLAVCADATQADRALVGLLADRLVEDCGDDLLSLPGSRRPAVQPLRPDVQPQHPPQPRSSSAA